MTEAQWYHILLEETVLKVTIDDDHRYIPCRAEIANPENDWETSWRRMRIKGLGSEVVSFLFKLLHQLLATQERLSRINQATSNICKAPGCSEDQTEDLSHALYYCSGNNGIGILCLDAVKAFIPNISIDRALLLQFEVESSMELSMICFLAVAWMNIWRARVDGKRPKLSSVKSEMESRISLWRTAHSYDNDILFMELLIDSLGNTNDS